MQLHKEKAGDLIHLKAANGADPNVDFREYDGDAVIMYGDGGGNSTYYFRGDEGPRNPAGDGGGTIRIGNMTLDQLKASNLRLHLTGDERDNRLKGAWGDDILEGGEGNDRLKGKTGEDRLFGDDGNDFLHGGRGDDFLHGGVGNDILRGGRGDDVLYGGGGDDTLNGGLGDDTLTGGQGSDRFHFIQADEASVNTITDFEDGVDRLVIRGQAFDDLAITQEGKDAVIRYDNAVITLEDIQASLLTEADFDFIA